MRVITVPVTMQPAVRKADDSVQLKFITNVEIPTEEYMVMDSYRKSSGWLMFSEDSLSVSDIPKEPAPEREGKSSSKRLYNSLYVLFKQKYPDAPDTQFDPWYKARMEHIIGQVQDQLEDK